MESKNLCHQEIERQIKQEEKKKDRTKKLHPTIVNMLKRAAATDWNDKDKEIAPTCLHFINSDNVGLAQYELIHQFKESGFPDVTFASGTTQALYLGDFLHANLSSPSNFTIFAFHEQEPNSLNQQTDYLICHLIQEQGQKKFINDIKAPLKQTVHVPKDFVGLGTQLQLFATASSMFFGRESFCTEKLNQLLLLVRRNKKPFRNQITLDKFFTVKFLFAVDWRVQRWLRSCKQASIARTQVNNNVLEFKDLLKEVLSGAFQINLPASFKKVANSSNKEETNHATAGNKGKGNGGNKKKRKSKKGSGNLVKNSAQDKDFQLATGKSWKNTFSKQFPQDRPSWEGKVKMCAR